MRQAVAGLAAVRSQLQLLRDLDWAAAAAWIGDAVIAVLVWLPELLLRHGRPCSSSSGGSSSSAGGATLAARRQWRVLAEQPCILS